MIGEPLWYWALAALVALLFAGPWLLFRWEERRDRQDREAWGAWQRGERP